MGSLLTLDLRDYLASGTSESVTAGRLPAAPTRAIGVRGTGGLPSVHAMSSGPGNAWMEYPRVQVLCRAATYQAAEQLATNCHHLLDGFRPRTINGTQYEWIESVQHPFPLEEDVNGNVIFDCNYQIAKQRSTSTST